MGNPDRELPEVWPRDQDREVIQHPRIAESE
jgi:hypothetical protein